VKKKIDELSLEKFSTIRDWYHMAILEMTDIKGFRSDPVWIASKLGLPVELVSEAVNRLRHLELLHADTEVWTQSRRDLELPSGVPSRHDPRAP
jgi:hypothetical protein